MASAAAFFDLDRTLLKRASGPLLNEGLCAVGLVSPTAVKAQHAIYKVFDVIGETLPAIALSRGVALVAKGWSADLVRQAGEDVAERLEDAVAPWAHGLLDEHRAAGRAVVLATTTPFDLILPMAERLGFDAVVATKYTEVDGAYTGSLDGGFVWGPGKRSAVKAWAKAHGVDLKESWAYSDSFYDLPLLMAVGHPTAVNPDPRLRGVAMLRRWPIRFLDAPPGVPKLAGLEPIEVARFLIRPELLPFVRTHFEGIEHIPREGPVIIASNHRSYFDPLAIGMATAKAGRNPRFLGKQEIFDAPVLGQIMRAFGQIAVDRESITGAERQHPLEEASKALAAKECVVILPQGTIPRGRAFYDPVLVGRKGVARLAARTGAPVVPIGLWGTEHVWPRSSKVPNVVNVVSPPKVTVTAGPAVPMTGDLREDTEAVMAAITDLLPPEAREYREPTEEEIRRASPSGGGRKPD